MAHIPLFQSKSVVVYSNDILQEKHEDFEIFAKYYQINFENFVVLSLKNFEERK